MKVYTKPYDQDAADFKAYCDLLKIRPLFADMENEMTEIMFPELAVRINPTAWQSGVGGYYSHDECCISLGHREWQRNPIKLLLHEVLHFYCDYVSNVPGLAGGLLYDLRGRGVDLVVSHYRLVTQALTGHVLDDSHDELFLLKSFDLDVKRGYKPGAVFGYDMTWVYIAIITAAGNVDEWIPRWERAAVDPDYRKRNLKQLIFSVEKGLSEW